MVEKNNPNSVMINYFGNHPLMKMVDFLVDNKPFDYSKKQIMEESGISKATLFKYFDKLEKNGIIRVSRTFGKTKLYKINMESQIVKKMMELELSMIKEANNETTLKNSTIVSSIFSRK